MDQWPQGRDEHSIKGRWGPECNKEIAMAKEWARPFYRSKEWQTVRQFCLRRDNYLCVKCYAPAEEVHHKIHLTMDNIFDNDVALNPQNLICLCRDCHFAIHKEDKLKGIKDNKKVINDCDDDMEFDANGYLIPKQSDIPPGNF